MASKIGLNIVIERENSHFIATSPDINVFSEGKTIDEAVDKFIEGAKFHLDSFPEERKNLIEVEKIIKLNNLKNLI